MPTNYKYIDQDRPSKKHAWRGGFTALVLLVLLIAVLVFGVNRYQTRKAEQLYLTGQYAAAEHKIAHWRFFPLLGGHTYEELGTARLLDKGAAAADEYLRKAEGKRPWRPASVWPDVFKILWANGRYADGLAYADHLGRKEPPEPIVHFYRAGFLAGENKLKEASSEIAAAGNLPQFSKEIALLKTEIDQRNGTGEYTLYFDRENLPLVNKLLDGGVKILSENMQPVLENPAGSVVSALEQRNPNQAVLTIDYRIQNAALAALGKYAGAIVLLDSRRGDILAAASKPKGLASDHPPQEASLALSGYYEPGSIIKVITLAGAIEKGVDFNKIFPVNCDGKLILPDNKIIYDWKTHGVVKDIDTAIAESCNVSFAKIGLAYKPADLLANLKHFGFNSSLHDPLLPLPLGKMLDSEINEDYLAKLSIGLEYLQMTPLHAAMVVSSIANGGVAVVPRLLLNYRNVIGVPFDAQPVTEYQRFMNASTAARITAAMQQVIQNPEGTGRRAAVNGFPFAMKTGTAGEGTHGFNAVVIGFGPVPNPKIAFAIFLEHAGKAEFEGARVTKLFLESIQGYI